MAKHHIRREARVWLVAVLLIAAYAAANWSAVLVDRPNGTIEERAK